MFKRLEHKTVEKKHIYEDKLIGLKTIQRLFYSFYKVVLAVPSILKKQ